MKRYRFGCTFAPTCLSALFLTNLFYAAAVRAEMNCEGFNSLLGYIQKHHYRDDFSAQDYRDHYASGLRFAVNFLQHTDSILSVKEWHRITTPNLDHQAFVNCVDASEVVEGFALAGRHDIRVTEVLRLQTKGVLISMDPHSMYYSAKEWEDERRLAESASLGLQLVSNGRYPVVVHVYPKGPADGLIQVGDQIKTVERLRDGSVLACASHTRRCVNTFLTGEAGEAFTLLVERDGQEIPATLALSNYAGSRVAESELLPENVGYVKLTDFGEGAHRDFAAALAGDGGSVGLLQQGATSLIVDLRFNPGGHVDEAIKILDMFLDVGTVVALRERQGRLRKRGMHDRGSLTDIPISLLVNGFSASAAEMLAGGLLDYERALLAGKKTFGKGSAQELLPPSLLRWRVHGSLDGGLRLTKYQYFTASGHSPQLVGIAPHVAIRDRKVDADVAKKRQEFQAQGYTFIAAEGDYINPLPAKQIASFFDPGKLPSNSMRWIVDRLDRNAAGIAVRQDVQLARTAGLLRSYQESCISFERYACAFEEATLRLGGWPLSQALVPSI